jgi:hypothetical protein
MRTSKHITSELNPSSGPRKGSVNAASKTAVSLSYDSGYCAFIEPSLVSLGNGLISERTASAMFDTYKEKRDLPFEERLMSALESARDADGP